MGKITYFKRVSPVDVAVMDVEEDGRTSYAIFSLLLKRKTTGPAVDAILQEIFGSEPEEEK